MQAVCKQRRIYHVKTQNIRTCRVSTKSVIKRNESICFSSSVNLKWTQSLYIADKIRDSHCGFFVICLFVSRENLCANPQRVFAMPFPSPVSHQRKFKGSGAISQCPRNDGVYPRSHVLCFSGYHRMSEMLHGAVGNGSGPGQVDGWSILTHQTYLLWATKPRPICPVKPE